MEQIVVNETRDIITVTDQDTNLPVKITNESIGVSEVSGGISVVSKEGDVLNVQDGELTLRIEEKQEVIAPQFKEVVFLTQAPVDDDMNKYKEEVDFVGDNLVYRGWANPGSLSSSNVWRVRRTQFVGAEGDVIHDWADGNTNFDNVWDDRATFSYS